MRLSLKLIALFALIVLVAIIAGMVFYLGVFKHPQNPNNKANLKGYETLIQSINEMDKDSSLSKSPRYLNLKNSISSLNSSSLDKKQMYTIITSSESKIYDVYYSTQNDKLYKFNDQLKNFSRINFPDYYKDSDFRSIVCLDPSCTSSPQPQEILDIIDTINKSSLPDGNKSEDTEVLKLFSYVDNHDENQVNAMVENYYFLSQTIKKNPDYEKAGINNSISDQLYNYLKTKYPKELTQVSGGLDK